MSILKLRALFETFKKRNSKLETGPEILISQDFTKSLIFQFVLSKYILKWDVLLRNMAKPDIEFQVRGHKKSVSNDYSICFKKEW